MSDLDFLISVSVSSGPANLSRLGFGLPLVLAYHTRFNDLYRVYSSTQEMLADGFQTYDDAYRLARAEFLQDPSPTQVVVGRLSSAPSYVTDLNVLTGTQGDIIKATVKDPQSGLDMVFTRTVPAASSAGAEATAFAALINDVDVDSIVVAITSAASPQTVTNLTGVYGSAAFPNGPRRVTLALNSNAHWLATTAVLTGYDAAGNLVTENLAIPSGGNTTLTTTGVFSRIVSLAIPTQGGTSGTATLGTRTGVTASVASTTHVTLAPLTAGRRVHAYDLAFLALEDTTVAAGYDTALTALSAAYDDWYFVHIDSGSNANISAVATWVADKTKLFFADVASAGLLDGSNTVFSTMLSNDRVVPYFSRNSFEFNAAGWTGVGSTQQPGFITWAHKQVAGQTDHVLTTSQRLALEADNVNWHQRLRGRSTILNGVVTSGEYIDVIHGIDALKADIQESVYDVLTTLPKTPFTQKGLDAIRLAVKGALLRAEGTVDNPGLIAPGTSKVILPALSTISAADKKARRLNFVRFEGELAGAIHYVSVQGTLV
jgi:hypothetical protein